MVSFCTDGYAEFHFFRPDAANVFIAGDFNDWRTDQLRMVSRGDGYWMLRLPLPAGDYRFRYVADGTWYTDYAAFGVEPARFGMDSVLRVPQRSIKLRVSAPEAPAATAAAA